jgi:ABC-type sugar transport system ATPase subunit
MTPDLMEEGARRAARQAGCGPRQNRIRRARRRIRPPGGAGEVDVSHGRILYLEDVCVSFDGFRAINKLSLDIAPGELRCIIGPNGAGKTTMMDIITGKTRPDSGTVFFGSTIDLLRYKEAEIAGLGIGRKFQKPTVFEQLTVFENLELALKTDKGVKASVFFKLDSAQRPPGRDAAHHPPRSPRQPPGRHPEPRPEAVAGDRHAADAGPQAAAARRTRRRHDRRGDRPHRRPVPVPQGPALADGGGARHGIHQDHLRKGDGAARRIGAGRGPLEQVQNDERVIEVYLGR